MKPIGLDKRILLLGATGAVGQRVARLIAGNGTHLVLASRSVEKAAVIARDLAGSVEPIGLDLAAPEGDWPDRIGLVIDCTGTDRPQTAERALAAEASLIDISASSRHLRRLEGLSERFTATGVCALIGVGLAPGLSTILATAAFDSTKPGPVDAFGVLDSRDEHGPAGATFTLGLVGRDFIDPTTGRPVRNFTGLSRFPRPDRRRSALAARVDFPDQYVLTDELGVPVTASLGFSNSAATLLLSLASRVPMLGTPIVRTAARTPRPTREKGWLLGAVSGDRAIWAAGTGQSQGTAVMTAVAAELIVAAALEPGVHHLHRHLSLKGDLRSCLETQGIVIHEGRRSA